MAVNGSLPWSQQSATRTFLKTIHLTKLQPLPPSKTYRPGTHSEISRQGCRRKICMRVASTC